MNNITVDFSSIGPDRTLFAGRKNGERARSLIKEVNAQNYVNLTIYLCAEPEQIITSSYFLGLFGKFIKNYSNASEAKRHLNFDGLSKKSQEECIRAVERGFVQSGSMF